jgi:hypothetical protein
MDGLPLTTGFFDGAFVGFFLGGAVTGFFVRLSDGRLVSGFFVGCLTGCGEFVGFIVGAFRGGSVIDDGGRDGSRVRLEVGGSVESNVGCSVSGDDVGADRNKTS